MTIEEFNKTKFTGNMRCIFEMRTREILSFNFSQALIGLVEDCQGSEDGDIEWVRCENVAII
jgi:hypothetical protein